jgi:thiamine-monophosphate kinase
VAEFDLIQRLQSGFLARPGGTVPEPALGIGDDAAVLDVPPGEQLVVTTDTMVEGVHFPPQTQAGDLGHKALAVNLSDLTAMGARPAWFFLALTMPKEDTDWLDALAAGMAKLAGQSSVMLAGGDMTAGGLSITITALGLVEAGTALRRKGARAGDLVVVSGAPGNAAYALAQLRAGKNPGGEAGRAFYRPSPRLQLGRELRGLATACIDLSDGLLADLGHILKASAVGVEVELQCLPVPEEMAGMENEQRWSLQLGGGDDYELCFTLPPQRRNELKRLAKQTGTVVTVIGRVVAGEGITCRKANGGRFTPPEKGFEHFSTGAMAAE